MNLTTNPFRPGAGRVPPELAGRSDLVDEFTSLLFQARESGEGQRPWILSGLRGVGKTALVNHLSTTAIELKLLVVVVEASEGMPFAAALAKELHVVLRRAMSASDRAREVWLRAARVLHGFQLKIDPNGSYAFGFDLAPEVGVADSGDLGSDLRELFEVVGAAARAARTALFIAVDELQSAPTSDLRALNLALHRIGQGGDPVPVVFLGAGLPSLPAVLADATSYAERLYDFRVIGLLDEVASASALRIPVESNGARWVPEALTIAVEASGGYPYFIQAAGNHIWSVRSSDTVSAEDARLGVDRARDEVQRGLYLSRWDRATPAQQSFLRAMAESGDASSAISDLVTALGKKKASALSVTRGDLIRTGQIYAPGRGFVAFTVPGMADWIRSRP